MFKTLNKIHFIGIGGSGMSGIAHCLANLDYIVSGSDMRASPITEKLKSLGVRVEIGHRVENLQDAEVVVVSSAINKHNPELIEAQNRRLPIIHRVEMLAEIMRLKYGVIVAGTHGKTTTTSMLATSLSACDLDPTIVIGGQLNALDSHSKLGKGELFVAEADESDGSFLRLTPTIAVITNIDKDHLDFYGNMDEIIKAFRSFIEKVPFYGAVVACLDCPIIESLLPQIRRKIITYGFRKDADITVQDLNLQGFLSTFTPVVFGKRLETVTLHMPGSYNVSNALASFAVASVLDLNMSLISAGLSSFQGVLHRFTVVGSTKDTLIVDDYAHNPKKIETLLKGTRESFPTKKIIAIFQPHRYSRVKFQLDEFAECFKNADHLIITPIYAASEQPNSVSLEQLAQKIKTQSFNNNESSITVCETLDDSIPAALAILEQKYDSSSTDGNIILTVGAGDVRLLGPKILEKIKLGSEKNEKY